MDNYEIGFQLILHAGNAKSKALMAIEESRKYNFSESELLLKEAKENLRVAHTTHASLIQKEAAGEKPELNLLLVHAQDHLSMALTVVDQAEEFIHIYKILNKLLNSGGQSK